MKPSAQAAASSAPKSSGARKRVRDPTGSREDLEQPATKPRLERGGSDTDAATEPETEYAESAARGGLSIRASAPADEAKAAANAMNQSLGWELDPRNPKTARYIGDLLGDENFYKFVDNMETKYDLETYMKPDSQECARPSKKKPRHS
mmetsp:Transcript_22830/g.51481  ORF Transcript_22830/g.51481 Transcript_22830/m.51481 type:complete len:149 (+) Transcript_22830:473-919(+)